MDASLALWRGIMRLIAVWRKLEAPDIQQRFKRWFLPYALRMLILPVES